MRFLENHEKVFICSINIPKKSVISPNQYVHYDYKILEKILTGFYESLRKTILQNVKYSGAPKKTEIIFDRSADKSNKIQATVYIEKNSIKENADEAEATELFHGYTLAIANILLLSIDLLVIERYHSVRKYIEVQLKTSPILSMHVVNGALIVTYSHAAVIEIANKLQTPLANMYNFDENLYITIDIAGKTIEIPGLEEVIQQTEEIKEGDPMEAVALIQSGNQSKDRFNFLMKIGINRSQKLKNVTGEYLSELQCLAKNEDSAYISFFPIYQVLRGITRKSEAVIFVKLLGKDEVKAPLLIPLKGRYEE